jgi:O-antigen/teichoic acid export membrane protein
MIQSLKERSIRLLRWSEKYTKTDMVYFMSGNFWLTTSRVISVASGLLLAVAFANFLKPEVYGIYKYIITIAGLVGAFSLGGLGGALARAVAQGKKNVVHGVFWIGFVWCIPASIVALFGSLYYFWNGNIYLGVGLLLIGITNPFLNNLGNYKDVLLGEKNFRTITLYSIPRGLLPIIALITAVIFSGNVIVLLITYFASNLIVSWVVYILVTKKYNSYRGSDEVKETVTYGKHLSVMGLISQTTDSLDQLLLWHFTGPVQIAIYSFSLAPIREIRNFSENIYPLIFPKFVTKTVKEMKQIAPLRIIQLVTILFAVSIAYIFSAPFLFKLLFPKYLSAVFPSQLLAGALVLQADGIVDTMIYARGNTRLRYINIATTQAAKALSWIILIPLYGIVGAISGMIISDIVAACMSWWAYHKLT